MLYEKSIMSPEDIIRPVVSFDIFVFMFKYFQIMFINHKVQFHSSNNLNILWEHVRGFHPASQSPFGHSPFSLLHPTLFKQWHLLLQSLPKVPWSHAVIRNHSNNENKYVWMKIITNANQLTIIKPVSSPKLSTTSDVQTNDGHLFY